MSPQEKERRAYFVDTLRANVDNTKLNDGEFREFVRNSLKQFTFEGEATSGDLPEGPYGVSSARR